MTRFSSGRRIAGPAGAVSHVVGSCARHIPTAIEVAQADAVRDAARSRYLTLLARQEQEGWAALADASGSC